MGFNGGGGGALPAHEHTNLPLDGGPLDFAGVTIGSMAQGDLTYSDGATLQVLNLGNATETLTVNGAATAPEWVVSAAAGSGNLELIETKTATGNTTTDFDFTFASPLDFSTDTAAMFFVVVGGTDSGTDVRARVGDTTTGAVYTTNYDLTNTLNTAGTVTGSDTSAADYWAILPSIGGYEHIAMFGYVSNFINNDGDTSLALTLSSNAVHYTSTMAGANTTFTDGTLKYFNTYVSSSYFENDSSCTCYKIKRA
jgi:hypothetical protein